MERIKAIEYLKKEIEYLKRLYILVETDEEKYDIEDKIESAEYLLNVIMTL